MADTEQLLQVPLHGLGPRSLELLSAGLRVQQVIPEKKKNYSRDWRVLAQLALTHDRIQILLESSDPVRETLKLWPTEAKVGQLISVLEAIERYDVLEDCMEVILEDCQSFLDRRDFWKRDPFVVHSTKFRAFVVHAEKDTPFVLEMVTKVEEKGIPLFVPARDLPASEADYIHSLTSIMQHRCLKVILVISQALADDVDCMTLLDRAENIHSRNKGRIIPIILEDCDRVGSTISILTKVMFTKNTPPTWAWPRLMDFLELKTEEEIRDWS